ncbi:exosome complex component RRP46 [Venturia canescens]|uniref:exosome complex component RRP46 n=1 Tax=Venturia canescens TaxID=32260 RepID=UPI001C9C37A5|nr:exosome complex component RRP46 [Venturia canescens]
MGEITMEVEYALRPMNCELNQLSMSDGSSMFMQGNTSCIAGVYGPVEARLQKMIYDKASVEVTFSPLKGPPSIEDRSKELYIKETCESSLITALHPSTSISINIQEMQDAGGLLGCAINAACMALINSSLPMKYTIAAVNCMIDKESGKLLLDPDAKELQNSRASFTFAFESIKKELVCCHTTGRFNDDEFFASMEKCRSASQHVFEFYREIVKKYANRI